ncbi:MAG: hypothetical protein J6T73_00495 [Clostridia bacterium]|nr:hypothetical protein [Clostridia bacterium]
MKKIVLRGLEYSPGYGDMRGTRRFENLKKNEDGGWIIVSSNREYFDAPTVTTTYEVSEEAVAQFEDFLKKAKILSLAKRKDSKDFITDYSPWSFRIDLEDGSYGDSYTISQYKRYSRRDYRLLEKLREQFYDLRGRKISEVTEKKE